MRQFSAVNQWLSAGEKAAFGGPNGRTDTTPSAILLCMGLFSRFCVWPGPEPQPG
jgi:hypothetical protein